MKSPRNKFWKCPLAIPIPKFHLCQWKTNSKRYLEAFSHRWWSEESKLFRTYSSANNSEYAFGSWTSPIGGPSKWQSVWFSFPLCFRQNQFLAVPNSLPYPPDVPPALYDPLVLIGASAFESRYLIDKNQESPPIFSRKTRKKAKKSEACESFSYFMKNGKIKRSWWRKNAEKTKKWRKNAEKTKNWRKNANERTKKIIFRQFFFIRTQFC